MQENEIINYETDSIRILYEALLAEYISIRSEIALHVELHERIINYLILTVAAVVSLAGLSENGLKNSIDFLEKSPVFFLVLALVFFIFPLLAINRSVYVVTLELYEWSVLAPKIKKISSLLSGRSAATKEFNEWERVEFQNWHGPMKWREFYYSNISKKRFSLFGYLAGIRYFIMLLPCLCFVYFFMFSKNISEIQIGEIILLFILLVALIAFIRGSIYSNRIAARIRENGTQ